MHYLLAATAAYILSLAFLCFPPLAAAQGAPAPLVDVESEYVVDSWQTELGLADDFVNDIAQSPDGYLWILTFNGLSRFNGTEFVTFDAANTPELDTSRMTEKFLDHTGRLWIRSESGSWVYWWKGRFKRVGSEGGLPGGLHFLREDSAGEIWMGSSADVTNYFHLSGDLLQEVRGTGSFISKFGLTSDIEGRGWTIQSNRLCCVDPVNPIDTPVPNFNRQGWRLVAARDGGIWVIANHIQKYRHGEWTDFGPVPLSTDRFNGHLEDRNGNLWIGTDLGEIWRVATNGVMQRLRLPGSPGSQLGRGLIEDAEGDIWLGTGGGGLFRLKPRNFRVYSSRDGLASDLVRSVTQDRAGNVWCAAVNRVDWWQPVKPSGIESRGLEVILPWEVLGATDGSVWVGTFGEGLFHQTGNDGEWINCTRKGGVDPTINVLFEERSGELDLGTPQGLYRVKSGHLTKCEGQIGISGMDVRAIAEDSRHQLFLGLESQGLVRKSAAGWDQFTTKEGLPDNHIRALWVDRDDAVWIGTHGRGLSRFKDGRFFNFNQEAAKNNSSSDLPARITSIVEDDLGSIWLASNRGLFRAERQQLNRVADGIAAIADVVHYDRFDGLGSSQCTADHQPAAWKGKDGRLWFATMKGVVVADPKTLQFNSRPPPVVIEGVYVNDSLRPLAEPEGNQIKLPAGGRRLEFRYAALSFTAPAKVRYRFRLKGFDQDWVNAGNRRSAFYTKVPPGPYRFEVIAANNDNVWNTTGAFIDVRVLPLFWQTSWFPITVVLVLAGAGLWTYHLRVRRLYLLRAMQESYSRRLIESQENERKRMAAELHDGLGQNLLVLNNQASMALKELPSAEKIEERLRKICQGASSCIEEVRSVARSLRPYQLDRFGLSKTLEDIGELLSSAAGLRVTTEVQNVDGLLSPEAEISVYRVAQEWLNNVLKHAHATEARLRVAPECGRVRLILEDNGVGFDYAAVMTRQGDQKSFGLINLRERARLLGGTAEIETTSGQGTRLTINIPYANPPSGSNR